MSLIRESGVYCDDSGAAPCIAGEGEEQIQTPIKLKGGPMATRENIPFRFPRDVQRPLISAAAIDWSIFASTKKDRF